MAMKMHSILLSAIFTIFLSASCKKDKREEDKGKDLILTEREQQKVESDNQFTFKLFKEALSGHEAGKNLMLSPLSVSMAIGMTGNGSKGETLEGMRTALEFKNFTEEEVNSYYGKLIRELPLLDPKATLKIANSIWYRSGFDVLPAFLQTNVNNYKATVEALDFASPAAKNKINDWVNTNTNGKIPTIIDEVRGNAVMFLINAVYFKSNWKYQFDKSKTGKKDFYLGGGSKVQADFMVSKATMNSRAHLDAAIYELPYGNDKYSMVFVLPNQSTTAVQLVAKLDQVKWKTWMSGLTEMTSDIILPKFKFEYKIGLNDCLSNLGMDMAFSDAADFSRIRNIGGLQINEAKHKTFIEVNEEGTEAAAATSVGITYTSGPPAVLINRPFIFAIREMKTGLIVFTGIVNNPLLEK